MNEIEIRQVSLDTIETRSEEDSLTLSGYVAKFDSRSEFMGFYEEIDKRAFDKTLKRGDNIFALYNHDWNKVLGSTRNQSLELEKDSTGLKFTLTPKAKTTFMNDLRELVESGELRGMSFGFVVKNDEWISKKGEDIRVLKDIELKEVTFTPIPAYESSEVALRSYQAFKDEVKQDFEARKGKVAAKIRLQEMEELINEY